MNLIRYTPDLFSLLQKKFLEVYPHNPLLQQEAYFNWQFRSRDNPDFYHFWVILKEGTVMGFCGYVPFPLRHGEQSILACEPMHWWTDESARTGSMKLMAAIAGEFPVRLLEAMSEKAAAVYKAYGAPILELPRWIRLVNRPQTEACLGLSGLPDPVTVEAAKTTLKILDRFPEGATLYTPPGVDHHIAYTSAYLNWRYVEIPGHHYQIAGGGSPDEFIVFRIEPIMGTPWSAIRILEWSLRPERALEGLAFLETLAREHQILFMDFFCSSSLVGQSLPGFVRAQDSGLEKIPRLLRPPCPSGPLLICVDSGTARNRPAVNWDRWYITKGNSDQDREKK